MKNFFSKAAFVLSVAFLLALPAYAEFSDSEKAAKREELDRYLQMALSKTAAKAEAYQIFRLTAHGSTRFGYDSNVDLDKNEDGDEFYEEKGGVDAIYAPEGFNAWGVPFVLGARGRYSYLGYFDRDDMDRQTFLLEPYVRMDLNENLRLEQAYDFRGRNYDSRNDLNYLSQGTKTTLVHRITPGLSHQFSFGYEHQEYDSVRKAIRDNGRPGPDDREDDRYEFIYGGKYKTGRWTFNLEGTWLLNDSNDDFVDFNDYSDLGVNGSASVRVYERLILTGFGGYHFRDYASRAPFPAFSPTQEDDWFFAGGRIFYSINLWSGVDVTFTWYENNSNDPNHDYDGTLTSVGYHLYF